MPGVKISFRPNVLTIKVTQLLTSREFDDREREYEKYKQIAASIAAVGVIEPLVVFPSGRERYEVLDGKKRLDVLIQNKATEAPCIIATDDESFTYNRRVNYLSPIGEHQMILRALAHNSEEEIAKALNVDISTIRRKRNLLNGICKEAAEVLKDRRVSADAFGVLRKMKPVRQVEVAQLMVASQVYTERFANALLAGTKSELLAEPETVRQKNGLPPAQRMQLESETEELLRNAKTVEESYGRDVLTLRVSCRYVERILANRVLRQFIAIKHANILAEVESLLESVRLDDGDGRQVSSG